MLHPQCLVEHPCVPHRSRCYPIGKFGPVKSSSKKKHTVRVVELFAGVGGFRLGLERASGKGVDFKIVFSDQYEPGKRKQYASEIYVARFGKKDHVNVDIATIKGKDVPAHDLLVGGFPCQDYSVASTLKNSKGLQGKKGVLWWQIHRLLSEAKEAPSFLLLENVDRLLGSPVGQRGRDLAVMLRSLDLLGYAVEWRVINAADHGMPQRRRRIFLLGYHKRTTQYKQLLIADPLEWITGSGPLANAFPCKVEGQIVTVKINSDLDVLSRDFGEKKARSQFRSSGIMINGVVRTITHKANYNGEIAQLGDHLQPESEVPTGFYIPKAQLKEWRYLKGPKKVPRVALNGGHEYAYSEGGMVFPEPLDKPSRTIITGEGGRSPSRFKHVILTKSGRYRRLTPVELERLNMFPDGHTEGVSDTWRAFFMGNALVVGVVERIGKALAASIKGE